MRSRLRIPGPIRACLFDLDGVLTDTAAAHAAAWKQVFDLFLANRARAADTRFVAFDEKADYDTFVDGRPRAAGVASFLRSRQIELPPGAPDDAPGSPTISGLGKAKNEVLLHWIRTSGVTAHPGSLRYLQAVRRSGLHRAVVSSSTNCAEVLAAAGIADLLEILVDGTRATRGHLAGKPAPDTYLAASRALGVEPARAAVFEDALAGVEAARTGSFGFVVGVDRAGQAEALRHYGADIVVNDLADLLARS